MSQKSCFTFEYVKDYIENELGKGYKLLSTEYQNARIPLEVMCSEGHIYNPSFFSIRNLKTDCPFCKNLRVTYEQVKQKVESYEGCKLLSTEYNGCKGKLDIVCKNGHNVKVSYRSFTSNDGRCRQCYVDSITKTHEQFVVDVKNKTEEEYSVLGQYKISTVKVKMRHNDCGHIFPMTPNSFLDAGQRCPMCCNSKGELRVKQYLTSHNIPFEKEYEFHNLLGLNGGNLRFDFAVFHDEKVKSLIEYDGEFHFRDVAKNGYFERQQHHDSLKNAYCLRNNIPLIRIHYKDFEKIEEILSSELSGIFLSNVI